MQNYRRETASPEELSADRPSIWPRPWVPFPAGQDRLLWSRGEGEAPLGGAGGGEAGLKAKSPHKAGFWNPAGL